MKKSVLKTPISYYGGKQKLVSTILPLIPAHKMYVEPFVGGGAIFFAKEPSHIEVINDTNKELINFYNILQNRFVELQKMVAVTLHSRTLLMRFTLLAAVILLIPSFILTLPISTAIAAITMATMSRTLKTC